MFNNDETPSWFIDWINKTFVLLNDVDYITSIVFDWWDYVDYTVSGKIITLSDAPRYSIRVDYYTTTSNTPTYSYETFWDIKERIWEELGQTADSINFSDKIIGRKVNATIRLILKGRVTSLLDTNRIYRAWNIWFLNDKTFYKIQWWWLSTWVFNVWDTSLPCTTESLLSSWFVQIWQEIISYSSKTDTTLEWCTWNLQSHLANETISQLYPLPIVADKPSNLYLIDVKTNRRTEIPYNEDISYNTCYEILNFGQQKLLRILWVQKDRIVEAKYTKIFTDLVNDTDLSPFPDNYWTEVVALLASWEMAFTKMLPNAQPILVEAYTHLQNMFQDFTNATSKIKQSIKPQAYKFTSIRR